MNCEPELEPMQRVRDSNFALNLRIGQRRHYGARFDVGTACRYVPCGHAHPQLQPGDDGWAVPQGERRAGLHGLVQQLVSGKCVETEHHGMVRLIVLVIEAQKRD